MTAAFDTRGPELMPEQVDAFEQILPGPLPLDYRQFLLTQNGGSLDCWWPPEVSDADFTVHYVYCLGDDLDSYQSLVDNRRVFEDRIPDRFLAVASDVNGNQLCLCLQGSGYGEVWFFDHELEVDEGEEPYPDLMTPVAASFTAFLETIEPAPDLREVIRRVNAARPNSPGIQIPEGL